jgi:predicted transcriptional regulator
MNCCFVSEAHKNLSHLSIQPSRSAFNIMALSVDNDVIEAKSRLAHIALLNLNLRFMENWRAAQIEAGSSVLDTDSLMIVMAIIVISADRVLRSELDADLQSLVQRLPSSKIAKVNLSSIAAATAINRETVRRKVNNLEKMGWVLRDKDGIRMVPGVISYKVLRKIIGAQLDALTGAANQLVKLGVLTSKQRRGWTFAKP